MNNMDDYDYNDNEDFDEEIAEDEDDNKDTNDKYQNNDNDDGNDDGNEDGDNDDDNDEDYDKITDEDDIERINTSLFTSIFSNLTNNESYIKDIENNGQEIIFDEKLHFKKLSIYEYIVLSNFLKNIIPESTNMREVIKDIIMENKLDIIIERFIPYNKIIKIDLKDLDKDINIFYKILHI